MVARQEARYLDRSSVYDLANARAFGRGKLKTKVLVIEKISNIKCLYKSHISVYHDNVLEIPIVKFSYGYFILPH